MRYKLTEIISAIVPPDLNGYMQNVKVKSFKKGEIDLVMKGKGTWRKKYIIRGNFVVEKCGK